MKRRQFIKSTLFSTGALSLVSFPYRLYAGLEKKYPHDRVKLGNSGIEVSRMAMGTGTNGGGKSSNQTRKLGIKGLADLLHAAYDEGVTFWDSADQYGSHPHLNEALKSVPREKVVILSKTRAATPDDMKADLDRFRKEIGTDYIDIILLHDQRSADWPVNKKGVMEVLSEARENGIVRMVGVSCHSLDALEAAADEPWVELDLARWNPAGAHMDADVSVVEKVLKRMKANGKTVMGMKVIGQGDLANKIDECLQFQLGSEFIDCFTIGCESFDQFKDLQKRIPEASVRA
ncbi:MAG: aldo/keto reductase [Bacteroides sp. SM23_62_1]|nr:MAG: aldo/keto reductase [Bacteroides sp. SM23_62_1]